LVDVGSDPREIGFWLVVHIVGLTDVSGLDVGTFPLLFGIIVLLGSVFWLFVGEPGVMCTFPLLLGTVVRLGRVFWLIVGEPVALWLLCVRLVGTLPLLFGTVGQLGGVFWFLVGEPISLSLLSIL